ncbi:MAG: hypothetical protein J7M13_05460 [Synergistetes bacterium]|nr:hypothetical protein [Synergistota bacterium]
MRLFLAILFLFIMTSAAVADTWTVMIYMNADNNLEEYAISDFLEMTSAPLGENSNLTLVVQFDRVPGYATSGDNYDDWTGTYRFVLTQGMTPFSTNAVSFLGEVNMGCSEALIDFVSWAEDNYPADHYALVLWNHGDGWRARNLRVSWKSAGYDETSDDYLYIDELQTALRILKNRGYEIDLIGFDECLMAMVEVAYEIRNYASFMVASEEVEPGEGWKYDVFLADLANALDSGVSVSPEYLGKMIINSYMETSGATLSLIDLGRMDDIASLLKELSSALIEKVPLARVSRAKATSFYLPSVIDLYSFCAFLAGWRTSVSELASSLCDAIKSAVRENYSAYGNANGLSIFFPDRGEGSYDRFYDDGRHDFANFTGWGDFLKAYLKETRDVEEIKWGDMEIDGVLSDSDIAGALVLPPEDLSTSATSSISVYLKNDQEYLYIGIRSYNDESLDIGDSLIVYLDSNDDGSFPSTRDTDEGELRVFYDGSQWVAYFYPLWYDYSQYRVRSLDAVFCPEVEAEGELSEDGFLEMEVKIPLGTGRFPFKAGSEIGYYLQVYDGGEDAFVGEYPFLNFSDTASLEPLMYGALKLEKSGGGGGGGDEFIASAGCSSVEGGSFLYFAPMLVGWLLILEVRKKWED